MAKEFDISRIVQFIKRDVTLLKGSIVTGLLVSSILLFLFCLFNMAWDKKLSADEFFGCFSLCYFPLGVLYTYAICREFQNPKLNHTYLSLPVSTQERITAKWLNAYLLYTLGFSLLAITVGMFAMIVGTIIFRADFTITSLFSTNYWNVVFLYFFVQPIFLVGALSFTKNRIGKTLLVLGVLFIGFLIFNFICFGLLNHDFGIFSGESTGSLAFDKASKDFSLFGRWFYGLIFGPLMLLVAYYKIKEKEV
ncbi:hypothetical protein [Flagellimonas meridianipacifica]|uniref:ABC-2 family transporter n=1 Tax=Flagellimonas meridianipacifica TaxID=1080225 RepID=A0A2T0MA80_9FLAO|nr:hypothetical protein [Allomuricauda pacifica]PRX54383.1 hypothetical protein CLV81_2783 [Allomuricauda pacifica]